MTGSISQNREPLGEKQSDRGHSCRRECQAPHAGQGKVEQEKKKKKKMFNTLEAHREN